MKREAIIFDLGYRITDDGKILNPKNEIIKGHINEFGYIQISHKHHGKNLKVKAHRLQAYQKYGDKIYEDNMIVRHRNDIKTDNHWDNIAIGTQKDNMADIPEHIRLSLQLIRGINRRLYDYVNIKEYHLENQKSYKETMKRFNISSKGTLSYILNN